MPKVRILVVDDAVVIRRMVTEALNRDPDFEVAGVAANGKIALQKIDQLSPDAVTLDVEMPEMDGLQTVREIRKTHPKLPIVMFSTLTRRGGEATLDALSAGATDYVTKPANVGNVTEGIERLRSELLPKLKTHCSHLLATSLKPKASLSSQIQRSIVKRSKEAIRPIATRRPQVLCIGTSTGGPNALADLFAAIPVAFPVPVVVVQHMPPVFTEALAQRLDRLSPNACCEATEGQRLEPGTIYIAPGGKHMETRREGTVFRIRLNEGPPENSCRPAVDVLFRSVAKRFGSSTLGVVLTGMGQDGLRGSEVILEAGGRIWAQDEESSVVWGMPGYVAQAELAEKILPLRNIPGELLRQFRNRIVA